MFASWIRSLGPSMVLACALISACENSPITPDLPGPGGAMRVVTQWQHPLPQGNDLRGIWGFDSGEFLAIGQGGTVVHYDGNVFSMVDVPSREDLHDIWVNGPNEVYVAGFKGTLLYFDGVDWRSITTPTPEDLYAVCANSPDDIFLGGRGGSVWNRYNGKWKEYVIDPISRIRAFWAYNRNEVWVAGSNGLLYKFDGTVWNYVAPTGFPVVNHEISDLWGPGPQSISIIVGGSVSWLDSTGWSTGEVFSYNAFGLWGWSIDDQIVISSEKSSHVFHGVTTWYYLPTIEPYYDAWGLSRDDCYAVGRYGQVAHFDGTGWEALNRGSTNDLGGIWVNPNGTDAIAVGHQGMILRGDGSGWVEDTVDARYELAGVWSSGGGLSVAVGRYLIDDVQWREAILMNSGSSWTDVSDPQRDLQLFGVWGSSAGDLYAVGWAGEILHYDGTTWAVADSGRAAILRSVHGTSSSDVFVAGRTNDLKGVVFHFDGSAWTRTVVSTVEDLCGVWAASPANVFAVGALGGIVRYDGTSWSKMESPTIEKLFAVCGISASDVYAAGWGGTLVHFDGTRWQELVPATQRNFNAMAARSANEILLAGDRGTILLYEGTR